MATWNSTLTSRMAPLRALTLTRHEDGVGPRNPPLIGRLPEGLGLAPLPVHDPLPAAPAPSVAEARERLLQLGGLMGRQKGPGPAMMLVRVPPLLDFIHRHRVAFSASGLSGSEWVAAGELYLELHRLCQKEGDLARLEILCGSLRAFALRVATCVHGHPALRRDDLLNAAAQRVLRF